MRKKKKAVHNGTGITVCDSIVMSVKNHRINTRQLEASLIAVIGYVSTIMVFLTMFEMRFNTAALRLAATVFTAVYLTLALIGRKALWVIILTVFAGAAAAAKNLTTVIQGYKYVYNIIYKTSFHTEIEYYKLLDPFLESESITIFFIFVAWLLAVDIYIFTVYHPNPIPPLIVVFSIIEVGMYNGIPVSIFWGILVIAYLLAIFAMCSTDMGEYSGGNGGFVRKDDLFFPKRQMKLKVTERCGIYIILFSMAVAFCTSGIMKWTGYKRSDEINQKRVDIRDAVNSFSVENLADSISDLTRAFGFTFRIESHKLGTISAMKYKDRTDLCVTLDRKLDGAIYLKEYTGSVYRNNEWSDLPAGEYNDVLFDDFYDYGVYPQDFPGLFNRLIEKEPTVYHLDISSKLKGDRSFSPYGIRNDGKLSYHYDGDVTSKKHTEDNYAYDFLYTTAEKAGLALVKPVRNVYTLDSIDDEKWRNAVIDYGNSKGIVSYNMYLSLDSEVPHSLNVMYENPDVLLAEVMQTEYDKFVYKNYLQLPDTESMDEVREEFADILGQAVPETAVGQLELLTQIRDRISAKVGYSLNPGKTPGNRDFVNYFLLENEKGYCTHYATSGVVLARMAGIPARYATGYVLVADDFSKSNRNADGSYTIELKDNRSHAWAEVYLSGYGWVPFEFTAGYTEQSIDTTPTTTTTTEAPTEAEMTETTAVAEETEPETVPEPEGQPTTARSERADKSTTTAAVQTTIVTSGGGTGGERPHIEIPESVKSAAYYVSLVVLMALLVLFRRRLVLYIRRKHFTEGASTKRIGYMFDYAEDLLAYLNTERGDMQYADFAKYAEKKLGIKYIGEGEFIDFVELSLKITFSEYSPAKDELERCVAFTEKLADNICKSANLRDRIYLKLILCYM